MCLHVWNFLIELLRFGRQIVAMLDGVFLQSVSGLNCIEHKRQIMSTCLRNMAKIISASYFKGAVASFVYIPTGDTRWHGSPRKHKPSSSNSDSITNGGASAVTMRNTVRAPADKPAVVFFVVFSLLNLEQCLFMNGIWFAINLSWPKEIHQKITGHSTKKIAFIITWNNNITARPNDGIQSHAGCRHQSNATPFGRCSFAVCYGSFFPLWTRRVFIGKRLTIARFGMIRMIARHQIQQFKIGC